MQHAANLPDLIALRRYYKQPHELYEKLRAYDAIHFDPRSQSWLVTGHRAVSLILDDPRFTSRLSSVDPASSNVMSSIARQMLFMDGEQHQRSQAVMLRPLARMVKNMPDDIAQFARTALTSAQKKGEMDAVSEFASPISLLTIAAVLGMTAEEPGVLHQLERWSDTFGDVTSGYFRGDIQDIARLEDYFRRLIATKRQDPGQDLLSEFVEAKDIFQEDDDLIANCMMVFAAGRITTKKLLGNGLSLLAQHWDEYRQYYRENPSFLKPLSEELLRIVTPTRYVMREASEDIDFSSLFSGSHVFRKGQKVLLFLEAANYDPALFSQPEYFQPDRRPNKHLAFGYGLHQCPGATLARFEIQVALQELFTLPHLQVKPGTTPDWNTNPNLGGYTSNVMTFLDQ